MAPVARRRRIALVGPHPASRGGVAATVRTIEATLGDEFDFVTVATQVDGTAFEKVAAGIASLRQLAHLCRRGDVDLVHVHASAGISFARKATAAWIARRRGIPVVLHVHGGGFGAQLRGRGSRGAVGRRALRNALVTADAVVALTPGWAADLGRFAPIARLHVVPNSPDLDAPVVRNGAVATAPPTIAYLGHLYRDKGVYELLDAFATLRRSRPDLRLVLAGEGRESEALREYASGCADGGVELPGWVGPEAKGELLATARCLVLPSYHEGLPLVVLEAMHAGIPIVATAVGGVPEVARDGREALLVEPRDRAGLALALARVLDDDELAARLGAAAQARAAADYSAAAFAQRIAAVYEEVLEQ